MIVYDLALATAGNLTCSGTPNTETDAVFVKAGSAGRAVWITEALAIGKAGALTSISSIGLRACRFATASTSGTGITPRPRDLTAQAAKHTSASRPTAGSTRVNCFVIGCGAGSPSQGFWARDTDEAIVLESGYAGSFDLFDISPTASLTYELSLVTKE